MKIQHIINPVRIGPKSDLYIAQPITYASMRAAREFARLQGLQVELHCVHYEEDDNVAGEGFHTLPYLTRSVLDVGSFTKPRKLPLIADILNAAYAGSDADYIVYTNADIGLMPSFYVSIASWIERGYAAVVINRRTMPNTFQSPADLPMIYAHLGESHPGFDCFVIHRSHLPKFDLGLICIGAPALGRAVLMNIIAHARPWILLKSAHLTFHIGNWRGDVKTSEYTRHNNDEYRRLSEKLQAAGSDNENLPAIMAQIRKGGDKHSGDSEPSSLKQTLKRLIRADKRVTPRRP